MAGVHGSDDCTRGRAGGSRERPRRDGRRARPARRELLTHWFIRVPGLFQCRSVRVDGIGSP
ncbi:MAG: hypothetical protein AVDCRST_MAG07-3143 [uncultured Frankineae bacterium]|uniref:Uncharacterized protein n=1 Tax=uncultured Frankineae bacterium TaxID=437475 RepID=A0A6J4M8J7_9ACTN|nr:MAG: hypothetical protein AVDCRST_MAG07-3143 [uncultured Frankineae bacterium]